MTTEHSHLDERDIEVLRQRWDEGKASGRAGPLDIKRLIAEERHRLDGCVKQRHQVDMGRARKAVAAKPNGKV
jgi:hypothetical protein